MAQLNGYTNSVGGTVLVPLRPVDQYDPNGIARITPEESRDYAKLAYTAWIYGTREETQFTVTSNIGWTGGMYLTFTNGTDTGYIWFTKDGAGADPAPGGTNHGVVNVLTTDSVADIAVKLNMALNGLTDTSSSHVDATAVVDATNHLYGTAVDATAGTAGAVLTVSITVDGTADGLALPWDGIYTDHEGPQNLNYR